jgi:glycosyltransferase involved in cell wall biosynthesis
VVWFYGIIDPEMQRNYGVSDEQLAMQFALFREMLPRVTLVQVPTYAERVRHMAAFPEAASKFVDAPFFLPHILPLSRDEIVAKHRKAAQIRVLFVGNEAWRKGLDIVVSAMRIMPSALRARIQLTVISRQLDPTWFEGLSAETHFGMPQERVRDYMNRSHVLVMPSRQESFGFVFVEAMAAGCAIVAPHWEAQREITDEGKAGVCLAPEATAVASALGALTEDDRYRLELALAGRERYEERYAAGVVARQHAEIFALAATTKTC